MVDWYEIYNCWRLWFEVGDSFFSLFGVHQPLRQSCQAIGPAVSEGRSFIAHCKKFFCVKPFQRWNLTCIFWFLGATSQAPGRPLDLKAQDAQCSSTINSLPEPCEAPSLIFFRNSLSTTLKYWERQLEAKISWRKSLQWRPTTITFRLAPIWQVSLMRKALGLQGVLQLDLVSFDV